MRALGCLVALFVCGCAAQTSLVGKTVPPYPAGLTERSGVCLPAGGGAKDCQYSLTVLDSDRGGKATAVALELVARSGGQPTWRVVDSATIPEVRKGYSIEMGSCRQAERKDEGILAIVKAGGEKHWGESYWAVRFDRKQKKFASLPTEKIDCAGADPNCL